MVNIPGNEKLWKPVQNTSILPCSIYLKQMMSHAYTVPCSSSEIWISVGSMLKNYIFEKLNSANEQDIVLDIL